MGDVNKQSKMNKMVIFRKYSVALITGVFLFLLVIFRLTGWNRFKNTTDDLLKGSSDKSDLILFSDNLKNLPVIDIRSNQEFTSGHPEGAVNIPAKDLLVREHRIFLEKNSNGIILFSNDYAMLVRTWSLLSQMGYKNVFITGTGIETDEVMKYKFRPDTTIRPE
jgi:rhodanese-related sulfurtransferase